MWRWKTNDACLRCLRCWCRTFNGVDGVIGFTFHHQVCQEPHFLAKRRSCTASESTPPSPWWSYGRKKEGTSFELEYIVNLSTQLFNFLWSTFLTSRLEVTLLNLWKILPRFVQSFRVWPNACRRFIQQKTAPRVSRSNALIRESPVDMATMMEYDDEELFFACSTLFLSTSLCHAFIGGSKSLGNTDRWCDENPGNCDICRTHLQDFLPQIFFKMRQQNLKLGMRTFQTAQPAWCWIKDARIRESPPVWTYGVLPHQNTTKPTWKRSFLISQLHAICFFSRKNTHLDQCRQP